jgi:hypothetical protein
VKNQIITILQSRAMPSHRSLCLGLATLVILVGRVVFGVSAPVELAALGGVMLAVFVARTWWQSRAPWTRPGLSNALFTLLIVVALLPGAALRYDGLAEGGDRSIRDGSAPATAQEVHAPAQPEVPAEAPVAPPADEPVAPPVEAPAQEVAPESAPVDDQSIRAAEQPVEAGLPAGAAPIESQAPAAPAVDPTPEPIVEPGVSLTASGSCTATGDYAARLTMVIFNAPAVVTEVLVIPTPGANAVAWVPQADLPTTIAPGIVNWKWTVDADAAPAGLLAPVAVFVHVANMTGDPAAAAYLGTDHQGWVQAAFPALAEPCAPPPATEEPTAEITTGPAESPASDPAHQAVGGEEEAPSSRAIRGRQAEANMVHEAAGESATEEQATEAPDLNARTAMVQGALETAQAEASATPDASPVPTSETAIRVALLSPDETAAPGDDVTYTFRVSSDAAELQTVRLSATNTAAGWSATVSALNDPTPLAAPVELGPGQSIDVVVTVRVPEGAKANTTNDTTLHADVVGQATPAPASGDLAPDDPADVTGEPAATAAPAIVAPEERSIRQ